MKIFTGSQIREIDAFTIGHEPIKSIDLMERAAEAFYARFNKCYTSGPVHVFAGNGNNGGDALAIARMLLVDGRKVKVWLLSDTDNYSTDAKINLERLKAIDGACMHRVDDLSSDALDGVVIDGLFGSGLNRPLEGRAKHLVELINDSACKVVSIDIPSGLFSEGNSQGGLAVRANKTISFQFPKLAFLMPENESCVGRWECVDIGLHKDVIEETITPDFLTQGSDVALKLKNRSRFAHKGNFGHALLLAGSYGKMGAAILASKGCINSGVGLLTCHIPHWGYQVIQTAVPEAMASIDRHDLMMTEHPDLLPYSAIGFGPGIGTKENTKRAFYQLIKQLNGTPFVVDADGINILAEHPQWLYDLPKNTILTPHPGEMDRLLGKCYSGYERLQKTKQFAAQYGLIITLKGANTVVVSPDGECFFNWSGNAGMATAGSGDVLTGVILSLLAQAYQPIDAAVIGVYVHGYAGDLGKEKYGYEGLTAGVIASRLGPAFKHIRTLCND